MIDCRKKQQCTKKLIAIFLSFNRYCTFIILCPWLTHIIVVVVTFVVFGDLRDLQFDLDGLVVGHREEVGGVEAAAAADLKLLGLKI